MYLLISIIFFLLLACIASKLPVVQTLNQIEDDSVQLSASLGSKATLPCGSNQFKFDRNVTYVMWWKNGEVVITTPYKEGLTTSSSDYTIEEVTVDDQGIYRCRVHYQLSPSQEFTIHLLVVTPPNVVKIFNERDDELMNFTEPYLLGEEMHLACKVYGGFPEPKVSWRINGELINDHYALQRQRNVNVMKYIVKNLTRELYNATITCEAANADVSPPISTTVQLILYTPPLSVTIISSDYSHFVSGRATVIDCVVQGSNPAPRISWWLGQEELKELMQEENNEKQMTVSSVGFSPSDEDNMKLLTCRAHNMYLQSEVYEDVKLLNVQYRPRVKLVFISQFHTAAEVVEGESVYLKCEVDANPPAYRAIWKINDKVSDVSKDGDVSATEFYLNWDNVERTQLGLYSCSAFNGRGEGQSNVIDLRVMYKPICHSDKEKYYGIVLMETKELTCTVEAYPEPTSFVWVFEGGNKVSTPVEAVTQKENLYFSTLKFVPDMSEIGSVKCYATNSIGRQQSPCIINLVQSANGQSEYKYDASSDGSSSEESNKISTNTNSANITASHIIVAISLVVTTISLSFSVIYCKCIKRQRPAGAHNDSTFNGGNQDIIQCSKVIEEDINPDLIPIDGIFHREPDLSTVEYATSYKKNLRCIDTHQNMNKTETSLIEVHSPALHRGFNNMESFSSTSGYESMSLPPPIDSYSQYCTIPIGRHQGHLL